MIEATPYDCSPSPDFGIYRNSPLVAQFRDLGLTDEQIEVVLDVIAEDEATARVVIRPWVWIAIGFAVGLGIGLLL